MDIWEEFMVKRFHQKKIFETIFDVLKVHAQKSPICTSMKDIK